VRFQVGGNSNNKMLALKSLGVGEFGHLNGKLEAHLWGTYELLVEWGSGRRQRNIEIGLPVRSGYCLPKH
jgi:hypothetical protein